MSPTPAIRPPMLDQPMPVHSRDGITGNVESIYGFSS